MEEGSKEGKGDCGVNGEGSKKSVWEVKGEWRSKERVEWRRKGRGEWRRKGKGE